MRKLLLSFLLICLFVPIIEAQEIPAWTRKLTPQRWHNIRTRISYRKNQGRARFLPSLKHKRNYARSIKSTKHNFIYHKIAKSGLFSRQEKKLLLKDVHPKATLGELAFLHDQHAAVFNYMEAAKLFEVNEKAFWKHQDILKETLETLEEHYFTYEAGDFATQIFSKKEIGRLQQKTVQPPAYMLETWQLEQFAGQPTLQAQIQWTTHQISFLENNLERLLKRDINEMTLDLYERYYMQKVQKDYLVTLRTVLENSKEKRLSAIMRYHESLPGDIEKLTDAQRGGKLQFQLDTNPTPELQSQQKMFAEKYGAYATAEALQIPYEETLLRSPYVPELLGSEYGYLRTLDPQSCLQKIRQPMGELETEMRKMQLQTPTGPDFYTAYYRLYAQLQIYKWLEGKSEFFLHKP